MKTHSTKQEIVQEFHKIQLGLLLGIVQGLYGGSATVYRYLDPLPNFLAIVFIYVPFSLSFYWIWKRKRKERTVFENAMCIIIGYLIGVIITAFIYVAL